MIWLESLGKLMHRNFKPEKLQLGVLLDMTVLLTVMTLKIPHGITFMSSLM